jgi:hypothetical protein
LLRFDGAISLLFGIAQRQEAVGLAPTIGLIEDFALLVGIGLWGRLPGGRLQLLDQPRRLARHHDVLPAFLPVILDGFAAVETGIGAGIDALDALGRLFSTASRCAAISFPSGQSPVRNSAAANSRVSAIKLGILSKR